ncbi:hypothetical protein N665_0693s0012 [Sinapis alba]|nr:hypothetical protein N665_0693s0012 [Sinapis alba]
MEFWGVEVQAGKSLKVKPDFESLIHVSQASLDKGKKGETALLYVTVDGKKLVIGTLLRDSIPQISFDLVFEKEFELSHSLESGSVHFVGYKSPNVEEEEVFSDSEEEEEAAAVPAAVTANVVKADSKPKAKPAEVKPVEVKPESDEDDDESDEEDDSEEDGSDSEKGMDVDEDDSDDEDEDDSEDEEEETPKKPEVSNKKRPNESASKTPLSSKKAKPAEEKKGGHPATPHPAKKGGKSPMNANQSPKSGGQSSNKKQFNSGKQFGSNNKGKGKGKGRA